MQRYPATAYLLLTIFVTLYDICLHAVDVWPCHYAGTRDLRDPLISPLHASLEQLSRLPSTLLQYGSSEQLAGDCHEFFQKLQLARKSPEDIEQVYNDMPHVFQAFGKSFMTHHVAKCSHTRRLAISKIPQGDS